MSDVSTRTTMRNGVRVTVVGDLKKAIERAVEQHIFEALEARQRKQDEAGAPENKGRAATDAGSAVG